MLAGTGLTDTAISGLAHSSIAVVNPEWLTPVIAGIFVVIGGLISAVSGWWADERRSKREHRQRWHEQIRQHSAELLSDVDGYWDTVIALKRAKDELEASSDASSKSILSKIEELEARKSQLATSIHRSQTELGFIVPAATMFPLSSLVSTTLGGQLESMIRKDRQGTADYIGGKKVEFLVEIRNVLETAPKT